MIRKKSRQLQERVSMVSYTPTTARVCMTVALVLATVSLGIVLGADPSTNGPSATGASIAGGADPYLTKHLPLSEPRNGYVSSGACVSCHPKEYASWRASYHSTMTQIATPETVIGDFNNVRLESRGLVYNLKRRGDEFWVEMVDPDVDWANRFDEMNRRITRRNPPLPRTTTRVILTTGSHHMQTYWVASNTGREVRNLPFLYLVEDQRWVPREDAFIRPPDSGRMMGDWNSVCLRCHTTGPNPKYDFATKTLDTEVI